MIYYILEHRTGTNPILLEVDPATDVVTRLRSSKDIRWEVINTPLSVWTKDRGWTVTTCTELAALLLFNYIVRLQITLK